MPGYLQFEAIEARGFNDLIRNDTQQEFIDMAMDLLHWNPQHRLGLAAWMAKHGLQTLDPHDLVAVQGELAKHMPDYVLPASTNHSDAPLGTCESPGWAIPTGYSIPTGSSPHSPGDGSSHGRRLTFE